MTAVGAGELPLAGAKPLLAARPEVGDRGHVNDGAWMMLTKHILGRAFACVGAVHVDPLGGVGPGPAIDANHGVITCQ